MKLLDEPAEKKGETRDGPRPFFTSVGDLLPYPVSGGNWQSLAIFLGIAFVLSSVLSLQFWVGLPLNLLGWLLGGPKVTSQGLCTKADVSVCRCATSLELLAGQDHDN